MEKPVASSAASIEDTSLEGTRTPSLKEKQEEAEFDGSALAKQLSTVVEAHRKQSTDVEKTATEVQADPQVRQIRGFKWFLVILSLDLSAFLYGLDTTIAADIQAAVVTTFGNVEQLSWIGTGFALGSVATVLPIGAMYGRFNQKWLYLLTFTIFEIGSALCGAAPNMNALIVGRVIAGVGGSGIYLGVLNYVSAMTTDSERGLYVSAIGLVWGLGCVIGPIIGGSFSVSSATWRWAFYINLVLFAVSAPISIFLPPIRPQPNVTFIQKMLHFDWIGSALSATFWVLFTVVVTFAGTTWAWNSGPTIAVWVVFGVLVLAFALQQVFTIFTTHENRMYPIHLLKSRTQILLYIGTTCATVSLFIPVYYTPIWFQFLKGDTAIMAAVRLLPFILVAISTNLFIGWLLPRIKGFYMPLYFISSIFIIIGGSLMFTSNGSTPDVHIYGFEILTAFGCGIAIQIGYTVATVKVKPHDIPSAISLQNVSQIGSSVIALAISGQVFQSAAFANLSEVLAGRGLSDAEVRSAVAGAQSTVLSSLNDQMRALAVEAITKAMSKVYILVLVAGATMFMSSLLMRREKLFA